jgi:hypothetical protein
MRAFHRVPLAIAGLLTLLLLAALAPAAPAMVPPRQVPTPTPTLGGSGPGPGSSSGDPHLHTPDGLAYDFQSACEFIALESTVDDFALQLRQEPLGTSPLVSINTAVATNVAGDRVGIYVGAQPALMVNGQPTTLDDGSLPLPGGGRVERQGARYVIVWPDQSAVEVTLRSQYLDVVVRLAPTRQGQVSGLLGNADGGAANDLTTRGGTVVALAGLAAETRRTRLYDEFGASWRISQTESLFTYAPGEDTSTYTRLDFPSALVAASDLPPLAREMAEAVCRQAGVSGADFLADCALDVGVTGDAEFAASAAAVEASIGATAGDAGLVGGLYRGQIPYAMNVSVDDWFGYPALGVGETAYVLQSVSVEIQIDPTSQPADEGVSQNLVTGGALTYQAEVTYDTYAGDTWITEESFTSSAVEGGFYTSPDAAYGVVGFDGDETVRWLAGPSKPPETRSRSEGFGFVIDAAGNLQLCPLEVFGENEEPDMKTLSQNCAATVLLTLQPVAEDEPV